MIKIKWTTEKVKILENHYANTGWEELFVLLSCNDKNSIHHKASALGLKREQHYYSNEDVMFLKNNYHKMSVSEMALLLNKTEEAIMTKANRLKLHITEKWSDSEIALLKQIYHLYSNKKISQDFLNNRTPVSIQHMAKKLNLNKNTRKNKKYDKDDMIRDLKNLAVKLNRTPNGVELAMYGLASGATYRRYFGSYKQACVLADLDTTTYLFGEKRIINNSLNGDICFSDAETMVTDFFIMHNIPYKKEVYYADYMIDTRCTTKRCDWVIYDNIFVEYFGLPDKEYYYKKMVVKRQICKDNNIELIELYRKDLNKLNNIFKI